MTPLLLLLATVLLPSLVAGLSSDPRLPPAKTTTSRKLTEELLGLDLGYSVLNAEKLRQSMGVNLDLLERRSADSEADDNDYIYVDEEDEIFTDDEEDVGEVLPQAQPLVRDEDFINGGPNPTWSLNSRHRQREPVSRPRDKFWNVNGGPFWFPFTPTPPRRDNAPKKKLLVGDQGQCGTGRCEIVLFCMFTGGKPSGSCGGLFYACCERPGTLKSFQVAHKDKLKRPPLDFGPVQNDPRCGLSATRRNVAQRRIVGGSEAGFGTFPWQAYIRVGSSRCGGSLVNEWYVVTAGHCVARARVHQIRVTLGEYILKSGAEPLPGRTYGASAVKVHPYFKFTPQADRYDVAVIRLNRRVDFAPHISPICLPPKHVDLTGRRALVSGWGALEPGSRLRPKTLQVVDVPMIYNRECERWHRDKGINVVIYDEMLCAGYYGGGKDSCQGDSGGPLMTEMDGRWTLVGIVSAGYSCAKRGQPGIYHKVGYTSDWISHSIRT